MLPNEGPEVKLDSQILSLTLGTMEALRDCLLKKDSRSSEYKLYKDFFISGLNYLERLQQDRNKNEVDKS